MQTPACEARLSECVNVPLHLQTLDANTSISRHRHATAYASVILDGGYEEMGDHGRWRVREGNVIVHNCFDAHRNHIDAQGARVVNISLPALLLPSCMLRIKGSMAVASMSATELRSALLDHGWAEPVNPLASDWPDLLARDLARDPSLSLRSWALQADIAPETLSRGFKRVFGITPVRFRCEARARAALQAILVRPLSLAATATQFGYADQAHMSRAIVALSGFPPRYWQKVNSVQDRGEVESIEG